MEGEEILLGYVTELTNKGNRNVVTLNPFILSLWKDSKQPDTDCNSVAYKQLLLSPEDKQEIQDQVFSVNDYVLAYYSLSKAYSLSDSDIRYFPSKLGGYPHWLVPCFGYRGGIRDSSIESDRRSSKSAVMGGNILLECDMCQNMMTFLLQIYAPQLSTDTLNGEGDSAFHRYVYVFICVECRGETVKVLRAQLPRRNPYYDYYPFKKNDTFERLSVNNLQCTRSSVPKVDSEEMPNGNTSITKKDLPGCCGSFYLKTIRDGNNQHEERWSSVCGRLSDEAVTALSTCVACGMPSLPIESEPQNIDPKLRPSIVDLDMYSHNYPALSIKVPAIHRRCRLSLDYGLIQRTFDEYIIDVEGEDMENEPSQQSTEYEKNLQSRYYAEMNNTSSTEESDIPLDEEAVGSDSDDDSNKNEVLRDPEAGRNSTNSDKNIDSIYLERFISRISKSDPHILRYAYHGVPLWYSCTNILHTKVVDDKNIFAERKYVPDCQNCGSRRVFEFQILPHVISYIGCENVCFGTIAVYTCAANCLYKRIDEKSCRYGYIAEHGHVQLDTSLNFTSRDV